VVPANLCTNFSENEFEFTFSEPVDLNSFINGFTIYPPILEKHFSWAQQKIVVELDETLAPAQTYYLTLTTKCKDFQDNYLENSFHSIFCTGDSIPGNKIIGTINLEERAPEYKGITHLDLFSGIDTTLITTRLLKENNIFEIKHLKPERYIILAFKDKDDDREYNRKIEVSCRKTFKINQKVHQINIELSLQDSTKPWLEKIKCQSKQHIIAKFNEELKNIENILIHSKKSGKELAIWEKYLDGKKLEIITAIPDTTEYLFSVKNFSDFKGNLTEIDTLSFKNLTSSDSSALAIINYSPEDGTSVDSLCPVFELKFNKLVAKKNVKVSLINKENNSAVRVNIIKGDGKNYKIVPVENLKNYVPYQLNISNNCSDYFGNKLGEEVRINILPILYE